MYRTPLTAPDPRENVLNILNENVLNIAARK
jgi:hypothetical protein